MKKARSKNPHGSLPRSERESIHFRLCHVCLHLNESLNEIVRCEGCSRYLSLESGWEVLEKGGPRLASQPPPEEDEDEPVPAPGKKRRPGLNGLSVVW